MNSALSFPPEMTALLPACGGNWSSAHPRRPFLFQKQQPSKFGAHIRSGGRGFASFPAVLARAAQIGACRNAAKSLSPCFPFVEVNHDTHVDGSLGCSEKQHSRSAFA